jgi:Flp pilus assembly CpaE family ATPase
MQIKSEYTVLEAIKNLHRLDTDYWRGIVCVSPHGVDVLQAPGAAGFGEPLVADRVRHLLRFTRSLYGSVVIDLGRMGPLSMSLLDGMKQVYVVSSGGILELYEAGRVLRRLVEMGLGEQSRLILNRISKNTFDPTQGLEKALGHPSFWTFPECSRELFEAHSTGQFMNGETALQRQMALMVARSLGVETKSTARSILSLRNLVRALGYSPKPQAMALRAHVPKEIEQSR